MKLKLALIASLSLFAGGIVAAPSAPQAWQPPQSQPQAAQQALALVRGGMEALVEFMQSDAKQNPQQVAAYLQENVASRFDFERMAALVLGRSYYALTEDKRAELVQYIQQDFLGVLGSKLAGFGNQQVRFMRPRPIGHQRAVVTVGIASPGTYPARLDFFLHATRGGWKVYDISANGNSAISYYRQKFAAAWRGRQGR